MVPLTPWLRMRSMRAETSGDASGFGDECELHAPRVMESAAATAMVLRMTRTSDDAPQSD
ncbi:unannotated protein [freshwater metagenome]|uniref:Unannotated protein n=1 Tax=freshwater metagenome TaxID=449393 RepID=A0A6J7QBB0_9ZZZZ